MKKKILSFITMLAMLANIFTAIPTVYAANSELAAPGTNAVSTLDGKKILFVGCSYTYYGGTVVANGKNDLASRQNDKGFFYRLSKAQGAEVDVTDWCIGGHNLIQLLGGSVCSNSRCEGQDVNHLEDLTDRKYDYVVIQDISYTTAESKLEKTDIEGKIDIYTNIVKKIMDMFRAENPDVKFYYGIYTGLYTSAGNTSDALRISLERIKDMGVTILDWGTLTYDIVNGVTEVPGATQEYNLSSFKVDKDDKHQNILSGYLYALMVYCAITGETAVGQPYGFCYDENDEGYPAGKNFKIEGYIDKYYDGETNFPEILKSEADMKGLQMLTNEYIKEDAMPWKKYLYTVTLNENGGTDVDDLTIFIDHSIHNKLPDALTRDGYTFDGWYKDEALTNPVAEDDTVTADMTLYAKWTEGEKVPETDESGDANSEWKNPFADVKENDWFYDNVKYVHKNNLMNGTTDTTFTPDGNVTRAMLVTVLYRNEGEPATNRSIPFADVDMSAYYANAVTWAQQNGIVNGVLETEFAPDNNITREQLAAILYRYAIHKGMDAVTLSENLGFEDADEISEYAISSLNWATGCGLIKGYEDNTVRPQSNTKRAEAAALLQRFIEGNK